MKPKSQIVKKVERRLVPKVRRTPSKERKKTTNEKDKSRKTKRDGNPRRPSPSPSTLLPSLSQALSVNQLELRSTGCDHAASSTASSSSHANAGERRAVHSHSTGKEGEENDETIRSSRFEERRRRRENGAYVDWQPPQDSSSV